MYCSYCTYIYEYKCVRFVNLTENFQWPDDYCGNGVPRPALPMPKESTRKKRSEGDPKATRRSTRVRRPVLSNEDDDSEYDEFDSDSETNRKRSSRKRRSTADPDFQGSAGKRFCQGECDRSARRLRSDNIDKRMVKFGYIKCEGGGETEVAVPEPGSSTEKNEANGEEPQDVKPNVKELEIRLRRSGRPRKQSLDHLYDTRSARSEADAGDPSVDTSDMLTFEEAPLPLQVKIEPFDLPDGVRPLMLKDTLNKKFWRYSKRHLKKGEVVS